jgi:hypothetical protein
MTYAATTKVTIDRTVEQIRKVLEKHKATGFGYSSDTERGIEQIIFRVPSSSGVALEIKYGLPVRALSEFTHTRTGKFRASEAVMLKEYEQAKRSLWRLAYISIKAKLDSIAAGLTVMEREFFHDIIVPGTGGQTVGQLVAPQLQNSYLALREGGPLPTPPLLPSPDGRNTR